MGFNIKFQLAMWERNISNRGARSTPRQGRQSLVWCKYPSPFLPSESFTKMVHKQEFSAGEAVLSARCLTCPPFPAPLISHHWIMLPLMRAFYHSIPFHRPCARHCERQSCCLEESSHGKWEGWSPCQWYTRNLHTPYMPTWQCCAIERGCSWEKLREVSSVTMEKIWTLFLLLVYLVYTFNLVRIHSSCTPCFKRLLHFSAYFWSWNTVNKIWQVSWIICKHHFLSHKWNASWFRCSGACSTCTITSLSIATSRYQICSWPTRAA